MSKNLVEGLLDEMNRCRELLKAYEEIGPAGVFGHSIIQQDIVNAENALSGGDVVEMLSAYKTLKECQ